MMVLRAQQQGMTASGVIFLLGLIAFFTLITLRLAPLYYDNYKISTHLKSTINDAIANKMSPAEIKSTMLKRLGIDNVTSISADDIQIVQDKQKKSVDIDYEVRVPFIGNVDFIAKFANHAEVPNR